MSGMLAAMRWRRVSVGVVMTSSPIRGPGAHPLDRARRLAGTRCVRWLGLTLAHAIATSRGIAVVGAVVVTLCLVLTPAQGQVKNLLENKCPGCGVDVTKAVVIHRAGCRTQVSDECMAAAAFMKRLIAEGKVHSYTEEEIDKLAKTHCRYLVNVLASNWGFKTADEQRREAEQRARQAESDAFWQRHWAESEATSRQREAEWQRDVRLRSAQELLAKERGSPAARQDVADLRRAATHSRLFARMIERGDSLRASAYEEIARHYENLAQEAERGASDDELEMTMRRAREQSDAMSLYGDALSLGESASGAYDHVLDAEEFGGGRLGRLGSVATGLFDDFMSDPSGIYGGVDPVGVATDNMDSMWPDDAVRSTLVTPIDRAGDGVIGVLERGLRQSQDAARATSPVPPSSPPPAWLGSTSNLWDSSSGGIGTTGGVESPAFGSNERTATELSRFDRPDTLGGLNRFDDTPAIPTPASGASSADWSPRESSQSYQPPNHSDLGRFDSAAGSEPLERVPVMLGHSAAEVATGLTTGSIAAADLARYNTLPKVMENAAVGAPMPVIREIRFTEDRRWRLTQIDYVYLDRQTKEWRVAQRVQPERVTEGLDLSDEEFIKRHTIADRVNSAAGDGISGFLDGQRGSLGPQADASQWAENLKNVAQPASGPAEGIATDTVQTSRWLNHPLGSDHPFPAELARLGLEPSGGGLARSDGVPAVFLGGTLVPREWVWGPRPGK